MSTGGKLQKERSGKVDAVTLPSSIDDKISLWTLTRAITAA